MIRKHQLNVTGLSMDSRTLQPGDLFFALDNNYIKEAISKGAKAIFCEKKPSQTYNIPIIEIPDLKNKIGLIASDFYNHPSQHFHVIGITGTNGKTSCSHFIAHAFKLAGFKSAVIGTLGNGIIDQIHLGTHTTPDPVFLQKLLNDFYHQKVNFVSMETSSHGLDQGRVNGTHFEVGIFTNLTQDHLDYHDTMRNYAEAKFQLFRQPHLKHAVLNIDDRYGLEWANTLKSKLDVIGITTNPLSSSFDFPVISAENIQTTPGGLSAKIKSPWGEGDLSTTLWGKFNLSNLLCVIATLGIYQISLDKILDYISQLKNVSGRMQLIRTENKPLVIVDYAHTPDALLKTLEAIREHCEGELWCIFGCGGDRDKSKRPKMGQIAEQYADQVILTDDNPRTENSLEIIANIQEGISQQKTIIIEHNRRRAIQHAISCAKPNDVVLIAGKGHEPYQEIGHEKIPFNDILEVKMFLSN
jgi:UDP-N-acetylmuramoyl-L-alanyl-D-glutamate--2,6-diaminopimelate ligase